MPRYTRMKTIFLQGVIWLCLLNLGFVLSAIEPGYLDFDNLPDTNFSCVGKVIGGYYADLETNCQMFHVCTIGQLDEPMDIRFLCLNGTVFDQETRVCERVDEVDCTKSERFYHLNLELYGNTAPPILEESEETELPIISSTTSTTTTSRPTTTTRATRATFYTTAAPSTTTHNTPKVITSNQFPINSGPDIRFNPEEINIRLTPGSPPIIKSPSIKSPSVSYQQQAFNGGDARITVTTHTAVYKDEKIGTSQKSVPSLSSSTQKPKSVVSYGLTHSNNQQMYHHKPFDYNFQQTENSDVDYHTDLPSGEYSYHDDHMYDQMNYQSSNKKPQKVYVSSTTKRPNHQQSYVSSTGFPQALKQQHFNFQRTEKPPNLQLPVPLFPTLPPLTFSSPAPFTLTRHFEQKRSNDHQQRPRIIVSASASVSDASGRRLNYSLGTIGTSHLIPKAPHTYDEYKEDDVGLDPFYHDVPKVKSRQKRDLPLSTPETETETTTHWTPPDYVDDNYEPLTYNATEIPPENKTEVLASLVKEASTKLPEIEYEYYYEYIDDNYEPSIYNETKNTTETLLTTTEAITEASVPTTTDISEATVTEPYQDIMVSDSTSSEIPTTTEPTTTTEFIETTTNFTETTTQYEELTTQNEELTTENNVETTTENTTPATTNYITTEASDPTSTVAETTTQFPETTTTEEIPSTVTTTELPEETTTVVVTTPLTRYNFPKVRDSSLKRKPTPRHRFSSPSIHISPSVLKLGSKRTNPTLDSISEETISEEQNHRIKTNNIISESQHILTTTSSYEDVIMTEAPLSKSANPTEPKSKSSMPTTPLTKTLFIPRRFTYDVTRSFNCFGKELNKFYEDPRDCRLFHYCTPGYTKTQVLDMKYVCDYGTYFDSDKLICTKIKPQRCKVSDKQV